MQLPTPEIRSELVPYAEKALDACRKAESDRWVRGGRGRSRKAHVQASDYAGFFASCPSPVTVPENVARPARFPGATESFGQHVP